MGRELFHRRAGLPRWLPLMLSAAIFFLPLHFHVTSAIASQMSKECGCLHGTRTQAIVAPVPLLPAPIRPIDVLVADAQIARGIRALRTPPTRAPPRSASL